MNKKFLTILITVILIGLLSIGGAYAGNLIKNINSDGNGNIIFIFKKLKLSDEQKAKIEEILKNFKEKSGLVISNIKELTEKEKDILSKETLDEIYLNLIVESQIKNLIDLSYLKKDAYLKIVEILDNEQKKIFPTFIMFSRIKPFILNNEKIDKFIERKNAKIVDLIRVGKKLNLTDEQREILKEMIKEENSKKFKLLHKIELKFLIKKLNLSEDQISKIKDLFVSEKEKDIITKIKENNSKQREILNSVSFNKEKLSSFIDEYITFESEILNLRKNLYFNYLKILNIEQRQKSPTSIFFFKLI